MYVNKFNLNDFHSRMKDSSRITSKEEYSRDYINRSCLKLHDSTKEVMLGKSFKTDHQKKTIVDYMMNTIGTHQQDTHITI